MCSMLEIVRNLTIARFLWPIGIKIWLDKLGLVFCRGICNNKREIKVVAEDV